MLVYQLQANNGQNIIETRIHKNVTIQQQQQQKKIANQFKVCFVSPNSVAISWLLLPIVFNYGHELAQ